jgi:glycosyltransferase involved in cell wall biosynthesis
LWIAGDGPLRQRLEGLAGRLGIADRVRFLGWREDALSLLACADLLVCPSLHEPLGNVVIEAWSAGLPVVATASDGPAGLIEDGVNGILVPLPDSPGGGALALARAIERLCEDGRLRARLGQAGRRAYEAGFTEEAVVARYRRFFDRIAA